MSFDVAAEAYDRFMGRFSSPLAEVFIGFADLPQSGRTLDVGCGPGALLGGLSARFPPDQIAGVDPSESFIAAARERFPWADLRHGTAEALPFDDDTFDASLAQLVVHFMTDPSAGVREMIRVTRPGGVVAACVWDFDGHRAPQSTFFEALGSVVADIDDESRRAGVREGDLVTLLSGAGLADVQQSELRVDVHYADFDEWWEPYTLGTGPAGRQLAALSGADRKRVRARCRRLLPPGPFSVTATAWAARGIVENSPHSVT